jgi:hypothetical protein
MPITDGYEMSLNFIKLIIKYYHIKLFILIRS